MKSKKEYIILGIIIAALAAYLFFHETDRTHYELPDISKIADSDISYIKITKGPETIELKQKDDTWLIYPEKYPADQNKINPMVDAIEDLTVTAMVSEAESYHRYELDPENKITVQAGAEDDILRTFDVGKAAPSNRHTFILLPDDKRVYHARNSFRNTFDQTKDNLRDKTVLSVDRNQVQQVEITDKDGNAVLKMAQAPVKVDVDITAGEAGTPPEASPDGEETAASENEVPSELVWQDADGNPVKESDINNFFNNVSSLKCQSYIDGKTKDDFTDPMYTITISGAAKTYTLSVFEKLNEEDDAYPAVSSENDYPFMLPAYKMDNMVKKK